MNLGGDTVQPITSLRSETSVPSRVCFCRAKMCLALTGGTMEASSLVKPQSRENRNNRPAEFEKQPGRKTRKGIRAPFPLVEEPQSPRVQVRSPYQLKNPARS